MSIRGNNQYRGLTLVACILLVIGLPAQADSSTDWLLLSGPDTTWTNGWRVLARHHDVQSSVVQVRDADPDVGVAALVDHLRGGKRVFLIGRGPAAAAALKLALRPEYLAAVGIDRDVLAGVIAISGVANDTEPHGQSPPLLVLTAARDHSGAAVAARRFSHRLRANGVNVRWRMIAGTSHQSLARMYPRHPARKLVLDFTGVAPLSSSGKTRSQLIDLWREPPVFDHAFSGPHILAKTYPVDDRFLAELRTFYRNELFRLDAWPREHYRAIPLRDYLQRRWPGHSQTFLRLSNRRGQVTFWNLADVFAYDPVIVIGLDDEKNLHRLVNFYRTRAHYSWASQVFPPELAVQPLGVFLHLRRTPPLGWRTPLRLRSLLYAAGFELLSNNPLDFLETVPAPVGPVLNRENRCINCHLIDGVGGRAHHLNAHSLAPQGGYALPLRAYADNVLERFIFDNQSVARTIGVSPNLVRGDARRELLRWLIDRDKEFSVTTRRR